MIGIILAAGMGRRLMKDTGIDRSKALVEVGGKRLIDYALENLHFMQVDKIYIVVGEHKNDIVDAVGDSFRSIPIAYVIQSEPIGLINAISKVLPFCDTGAVVQLSDEIFINVNADFLKSFHNQTADFLCGIIKEKEPERIKENYSVITDDNDVLIRTHEKPTEIVNDLKGTGFCIFSKDCMDLLKSAYSDEKNLPCDLCDFMNLLIWEGKKGKCFEVADTEININTKADLDYAIERIEEYKA
ncbi:MAG: NTP transferase domain-containing protein [Clostridia bacterium]|nr:NTP transferase domain-containing protein [Clostridia bacterium]